MMGNFSRSVRGFLLSEDGPTAVEYAVMMGLIIAVCFAFIANLGTTTNNSLTNSSAKIRGGS
jgi:pilus assembly protein Flp/PilA